MSNPRETLIGRKFPVLDQGYVVLADFMGSDATIVDRARGTIGGSASKVSSDRALIRLMMRKHHGSSFEFPEVDIQVRTTFVVWRQMIRHRAGNILDEMSMWDEPSVNELSGRYSELPEIVQATGKGEWRQQSRLNRQGSGDNFPDCDGEFFCEEEARATSAAIHAYHRLIDSGVAKEQARKVYPMGGYTDGFMKMDLRNWLHFCGLRLAPDAQAETRAYAEPIGREILAVLYPTTWGAFEDYVLNAVTLSALDLDAIRRIPALGVVNAINHVFANVRERRECLEKLALLGMVSDRP